MASSRSPHGERGLKSYDLYRFLEVFCRSPHGERGLKYHFRARGSAEHVALLMESVD